VRVLVITNMYPPHHYGGYELSCQDTVRRFVADGHEVSVLTSTIRVDGVRDDDDDSALVRRDLRMYWDDHILLSPPLRERLEIERANHAALDRAVADAGPDVVSVWNMGALSLGLLSTLGKLRIPVVYVMGDDWPVYGQDLDAWSRLFRRGWRRIAGPPVRLITSVPTSLTDFTTLGPCLFNSESMRQVVRERSGLSLPSSAVVHPGVDTSDFPVAGEASPVGPREWQQRLVYVGRIDERKGVDTAVRALAHLPGAHLSVVGRGDSAFLSSLMAIAGELGVADRVDFKVVPRSELAAEYRAADALLFTSVYREPFGIVPLEAMACDTPVVATGVGGSGEYLRWGSNCLIYDSGDEASLAAAVQQLARDPDLRARLVTGGRETARRLTADAYYQALLSWHLAAVQAS